MLPRLTRKKTNESRIRHSHCQLPYYTRKQALDNIRRYVVIVALYCLSDSIYTVTRSTLSHQSRKPQGMGFSQEATGIRVKLAHAR